MLKEIPNVKFLIVGNGSLENSLKETVARYNLQEHVIFTGFVTDTTELLNAVDINVNASESEAMSLSVLEAMSLGKPSIATKAGGNCELITDGSDGLLIGYADSMSMALAMLRLICNRPLSAELGQNAYQKYCQNYPIWLPARMEKEESYLLIGM